MGVGGAGARERPRPQEQQVERSCAGVGLLMGEGGGDRCWSIVERGEGRKQEPRDSARNERGMRVFRARKDFGLCLKMVQKPFGSFQQRSGMTLNRKVSEY